MLGKGGRELMLYTLGGGGDHQIDIPLYVFLLRASELDSYIWPI